MAHWSHSFFRRCRLQLVSPLSRILEFHSRLSRVVLYSLCSLSVFLTAIIRDMGFTSIKAQGLSAPAWLVAYVFSITCGYYSDKLNRRGWFIAIGQAVGAVGYLIIAFAKPIGVRYFATFVTTMGVYMAQPLM